MEIGLTQGSTPSGDDDRTSPTLLSALAIPGNEHAWGAFMSLYSPLILDHCRRSGLQSADAEEIRSRVLAKLTQALQKLVYDPRKTFRGYLKSVVQSTLVDYWEERSRPGSVGSGLDLPVDSCRAALPDPMRDLGDRIEGRIADRLRLIEVAVERVKSSVQPDSWRAYWLTAVEELPASQVARELGKSIAAVHMAKHRVARLLKETGRDLIATHDDGCDS